MEAMTRFWLYLYNAARGPAEGLNMGTKEKGVESSLIPRLLDPENGSVGLLRRGLMGGVGGGRWLETGLRMEKANSVPERMGPCVPAFLPFLRNRIDGHVRGSS